MAIVLRQTKGSRLTSAEVDGNFIDLDSRNPEAWSEISAHINISIDSPVSVATYKSIFQVYAFTHNQTNNIAGTVHMPKDYVPGTGIYPHIHIFTDQNAGGTAKFGLTYSWANETDAYDFGIGPPFGPANYFSEPQTIYFEHTFMPNVCQNLHITLEVPDAVVIPELQPDSLILMKVFRNGADSADTFDNPIFMQMFDIYYRAKGFGSTYR